MINIYTPNNKVSKYIKQKPMGWKKDTALVISTLPYRKSRQKT